jgi:hypothetical protein
MNVIQFTEARRRLRGQPMLPHPRATAFRAFMFADRLDPWQFVFCRDLPSQPRPVSIPQCRALQVIVDMLTADGCPL